MVMKIQCPIKDTFHEHDFLYQNIEHENDSTSEYFFFFLLSIIYTYIYKYFSYSLMLDKIMKKINNSNYIKCIIYYHSFFNIMQLFISILFINIKILHQNKCILV